MFFFFFFFFVDFVDFCFHNFQVTYNLRRPQLNFIRLLSHQTHQEITLICKKQVYYLDNIQLVAWNKKVFNAADGNQVDVLENTCRNVSKVRLITLSTLSLK